MFDFEPPDWYTFRCLDLAYAAGRLGETAPAWLSAANEVVVEAFLSGGLRWTQIAELTDEALGQWDGTLADSVDAVLHADRQARQVTDRIIARRR